MPIGYLVTTGLIAVCTLLALAARRPARSSPSNPSYWLAFLVNELPFVAFYVLLASTLLAVGQHDIESPVGWVGLGLALLATAGLAIVVRRALRTRPALERALDEGLGAEWRSGPDDGGRRLPLGRILFAPFLMRCRDVERIRNLRYGDAGRLNMLDLYRHRSRPSGAPTFVHFHGGGFRRGRKSREARPLLYRLASQGWVCISANYRLSPAAQFPDHLVDAKRVIAWVREHGHEYGAGPEVLFAAGSSAGGNLAATAALTANDPRFQPGFEQADTSVTAAISLYGYYGTYHRHLDHGLPGSSPGAYVRADAPPFFVAHGDRDTLVIVEDARAFVDELRSASASPVVYAELPGAQHTFDLFHSLRFERVVDAVEAFAAWVRSRDRP